MNNYGKLLISLSNHGSEPRFALLFEIGSPVALAGLELTMQLRIALNSCSSSLASTSQVVGLQLQEIT